MRPFFFVFNNFFFHNKYDQYDDIEVDTVSFLYSINNNNNKRKAKKKKTPWGELLSASASNWEEFLFDEIHKREKGKKKY
jgi:hypothetical protein